MSRLYLRIFLSFWLVISLTIGAVMLINSQLERAQLDDLEISDRAQRMATGMSARAQAALNQGGADGLARWAEGGTQRGRRLEIYVLDASGVDLLERDPPRDVRRLYNQWQQRDQAPAPQRRGQFTTALSHPRHGAYLIVLNPPPRPVVLRIFGPFGIWGLLGLAIVFSGLVCLWLARSVSHPVQQLRAAGQALGSGQLDARAPVSACRRKDELGELARDFNRMADHLQRLIISQRQLLRDVSHELRSPLARLQVSLALATDAGSDPERHRHLDRMETEIERLDQLIGEILSYARISQEMMSTTTSFDLIELIEDIAESARLEGAPRQIDVRLNAPARLVLEGDSELVRRAIENVVRNALRHSPDEGLVDLQVTVDNRQTSIAVADQGSGVPADRLDDIFKPFVRLSAERSEAGPGGGIGLAIARAAAERHGGRIQATSNTPGLRVVMTLPAGLRR